MLIIVYVDKCESKTSKVAPLKHSNSNESHITLTSGDRRRATILLWRYFGTFRETMTVSEM